MIEKQFPNCSSRYFPVHRKVYQIKRSDLSARIDYVN